MRQNIKAFTLAETLITLMIVGIVAAMTLPVIIAHTRQEQFITGCKKMYSTLAQAVVRAKTDYGEMDTWDIQGSGHDEQNEYFVNKYILPYVVSAKICGKTLTDSCAFQYRYLNAQNHAYWTSGWYKIILNDGSAAVFRVSGNDDSTWVLATVDVNGDKKPNVLGKDIFTFVYWLHTPNVQRKEHFEAYGIDWPRQSLVTSEGGNACNKKSTGELCAALLMKDNWQMSDDYPVH